MNIDVPPICTPYVNQSSAALLQVNRLACERDDRVLYQNLSMVVCRGEIWHIKGANGVGKTSLLRQLSGLLPLVHGQVKWNRQLECPFIYLGHKLGLKDCLSAEENLAWLEALVGFSSRAERLSALHKVGLRGYEDSLVGHLSAGQKRRVTLARLHLTQAAVWLLDEPLTAIDQSGIQVQQSNLLQHTQQGGAVLLTSHQDLDMANVRILNLSASAKSEQC